MNEQQMAKAKAAKVVTLTLDEAAKLPGLLGKIATIELKEYGWYAVKHNGVSTYYELV